MSIFDGFKQIDDKTLYDLKFYRQTKWYAWGDVYVGGCLMYIIQYDRLDINDNPIGKIKFFGKENIMEFTDIYTKQDLLFVIDRCINYVKGKHKGCKVYMG